MIQSLRMKFLALATSAAACVAAPETMDDPIQRTISFIGIGCTVALTIVGIVGIRLALHTLRAIRRQADIMEQQTKATETAANAAKSSVDAIIAESRPWILIQRSESQDRIQLPYVIPTLGMSYSDCRQDKKTRCHAVIGDGAIREATAFTRFHVTVLS